MTNVILQSLGLDLVSINVNVKFYQSIRNFTNLTDDKCHLAIPWARSCQYQCVYKILSKYSERFKSYGRFSQTDQGYTTSQIDQGRTHRVIIAHLQLLCWSTFSGSCNLLAICTSIIRCTDLIHLQLLKA